ncbi:MULTISPECIES: polyphosphate polymerase domain-containing protein [unclassified Fusibacter]|uniref:polyphosphate polymerase domain-containing protein n=1 Tax=unclassified Fusibacter TaxID=2624464 RepID=UPI0013E938E4|nr:MULTISPECIES: polyphosphate polymerase domain-containing protein [unclassified Fusibacter]MCK8059606.1 polyphosphate polymerase domain-containing protein [Fusibacter sp. A2]NPE21407.1 polyphosphate polymerase domain-containing protein [Fusibacter sp. A1]
MRVDRKETKYRLNVTEYGNLCSLLPRMLEPDINNGDYGYYIRSLYFDSINDNDYFEKVNGVEVRKKIRLRVYGDKKKVKLEIKRKMGAFQRKDSLWISMEDAMKLQACDYDCLDNYEDELAGEIRHLLVAGGYKPVVLIDYLRKAYTSLANDTRVTLDSELRSSEFDLDLFSDGDQLIPVQDNYFAILEIKSSGGLPRWISRQLSGIEEASRAVSKYSNSRWFYEENNML